MYAFFDRYVKHDGRPDGRRLLHYYTLNEGTWRTTTRWPVAGHPDAAALPRRRARADRAAGPRPRLASDLLTLDPTAGSGPLNRWNTNLTGEPVVYPNRAAVDRKLLSYTTAPLHQATR